MHRKKVDRVYQVAGDVVVDAFDRELAAEDLLGLDGDFTHRSGGAGPDDRSADADASKRELGCGLGACEFEAGISTSALSLVRKGTFEGVHVGEELGTAKVFGEFRFGRVWIEGDDLVSLGRQDCGGGEAEDSHSENCNDSVRAQTGLADRGNSRRGRAVGQYSDLIGN